MILGQKGGNSATVDGLERLQTADIIILAPCGFSIERSYAEVGRVDRIVRRLAALAPSPPHPPSNHTPLPFPRPPPPVRAPPPLCACRPLLSDGERRLPGSSRVGGAAGCAARQGLRRGR